jgi:AraC-like DNA-binding protein
MYHYLAEHPEEQNNSHNRAEEYFKQFTHLLGEHFREERSVGFYARQLCITPKYLTTLIKRISGQSVSEWIDNYVILEAKTLLKYSTMSIQEIAYYLNFPNQSFFGSYFKRNTGMSPSQYKAQN